MTRTSQWICNILLLIFMVSFFASCKMNEAQTKQTIFTNASTITPQNISDKMDKVYAGLYALQLNIADGEPIETSGDNITFAHEPFEPVIEHSEITDDDLYFDTAVIIKHDKKEGYAGTLDPLILSGNIVFDTTTLPFETWEIKGAVEKFELLRQQDCKHVWVQKMDADSTFHKDAGVFTVNAIFTVRTGVEYSYTPLVCVKCYKEANKVHKVDYGYRSLSGPPFITNVPSLVPISTSDCENDCYE